VSYGDPQAIAAALLPSFGFSSSQMSCLVPLWMGESGWRVNAENVSSGAYGIPQALPGSKMATAGADWASNPATQIEWGLGYIRDRYGSPCGAWSFKQSHGWY
jgi:L-lactate permease